MESQLQAENQALRQQLQALLREARSNEDKMRRFELLEHRLIAARSLAELLGLLLLEYRQAFAIDAVSLILLDRDGEAARMLSADRLRQGEAGGGALPGLSLLPSLDRLGELLPDLRRPRLLRFDDAQHRPLFEAHGQPLASLALLPLSRHGELIGSLHFASSDPARYEPESGTQLLERLAAIVSVCLDNALNQERLKLAGLTDVLTGVHNRRYFEHRCLVEVAQARRHGHALSCLFLDLDHFKSINDRHGHPAGDQVLRSVGHTIQAQLRVGDTVARFGGEEFVVLLPQAPAQHARDIAERIRQSIAERPLLLADGLQIGVTVSMGMAMLPPFGARGTSAAAAAAAAEPALLAQQLVQAADQALYRAKAAGRNRLVVCTDLDTAP